MIGIVSGVWVLDADIPLQAWGPVALVVAVGAFSTAGIGLVMGAINLVWRDGATLGNVVFLVLLIFCGTNVAVDDLPGWMAAISPWLPLTHAIEAARAVADGATLGQVSGLVWRELAVGATYVVVGMSTIRRMESRSRRLATLEQL